MSFKFRSLAVAVAAISSAVAANAAGLDRSTQPSWAFTQDGTFAYVEHITIDPEVSGKDNAEFPAKKDSFTPGRDVPNMADDYSFLNFGAKADINDTISVGAFFDQPWGADVKFEGNNDFVGTPNTVIAGINSQVYAGATQLAQTINPNAPAITTADQLNATITTTRNTINYLNSVGQTTKAAALQQGLNSLVASSQRANFATSQLSQVTGGTNVAIESQNFTGLIGMKLGQNKNFQIYGGPVLQKIDGEVHLRGDAYQQVSGYDANIPSNTDYGWMAGVAYSKPEIALKASLTYRSEIDHDIKLGESIPAAGIKQTNEVTVTTPKSVNLDFQTGINPTTLLNAKLRWVPWSDFALKPKVYGELSDTNLVSYDDDAWTAEVGLGKKLSDKWAVSGSVGWDSGAGNPVTSLGPIEGNWNVGLGAKYNLTPEWAVSAGAKYLMFGDAKAKIPTGALVGDFQDNDGMVYGLRLSYQKK